VTSYFQPLQPDIQSRSPAGLRDLWVDRVDANLLLASLPPADFDLLAPDLRDAMLDRGSVLHESGEPIRDVYFPREGLIGLLCPMPDGRAVETASIGRDGAVGITAALGAPIAHSRAVVHLPVRAVQIPAARLADIADRSKAVHRMIVCYTDAFLGQAQQLVACSTLHPVQERMCRWLLQARDRAGSDTLPVTQEYLSDVLGVQRTTVTLISRMLQTQGIINVRRGRIQVRDLKALEGKACACYGAMLRLAAESSRHPELSHASPAR
jgi:CRP-like cAMP-binding protein